MEAGRIETLIWIVGSGLLMSALALVGSIALLLNKETLSKIVLPLVAFAAGSLLGGAFFHMIPAAVGSISTDLHVYAWVLAGFCMFFVLEQFLHWHHCHRDTVDCRKPLGYLILIGDGLHNFLGGLAIGGTFLIDIRLGITTWIAAALHEVPQELGDFGALVHGGWSRKKALLFNVLSALTFLAGGVLSYLLSARIDITFLVPLAAGNFLYIAASDLVPEVNRHFGLRTNIVHFLCLLLGIILLYLAKTLP